MGERRGSEVRLGGDYIRMQGGAGLSITNQVESCQFVNELHNGVMAGLLWPV